MAQLVQLSFQTVRRSIVVAKTTPLFSSTKQARTYMYTHVRARFVCTPSSASCSSVEDAELSIHMNRSGESVIHHESGHEPMK